MANAGESGTADFEGGYFLDGDGRSAVVAVDDEVVAATGS